MLKEELEKHFRPEFLNRVDDIVYFKSLTRDDLKSVIDIELANVRERLEAKSLKLTLTDEAKEVVIDVGYNPEYGARPLRRSIERLLEDRLSEDLLAGKFKPGDEIQVSADDGVLKFDIGESEPEPTEEPAAT